MPYEVVELDGQKDGRFCVVKKGTKEVVHCHPSMEMAEKQLTALRINVQERDFSSKERGDMDLSDFGDPETRGFPIKTQADVDNAARAIGRANDPEKVKRNILAICKRKGLTPPASWLKETEVTETLLVEATPESFAQTTFETEGEIPVFRNVVVIRPGRSANRRVYTADILRRDCAEAFEGAPIYATQHQETEKNARNLVGQIRHVAYKEGVGVTADAYGLAAESPFWAKVREAHDLFGPTVIGLSINTPGHFAPTRAGKETLSEVRRIFRSTKTSVDLVTYPAAGGRLAETVEDNAMKDKIAQLTEAILRGLSRAAVTLFTDGLTDAEIREANPGLAEAIMALRDGTPITEIFREADAAVRITPKQVDGKWVCMAGETKLCECADEAECKAMCARMNAAMMNEALSEARKDPADLDKLIESRVGDEMEKRLRRIERKQTLARMLNESRLPQTVVTMLAAKYDGTEFEDKAVEADIRSLRDEIARANPVRPNAPSPAQITQEPHDIHRLRLEAFFRGASDRDLVSMFGEASVAQTGLHRTVKDKDGRVVKPYTSFRWEILPQMAGVDAFDPGSCREALGLLQWQGELGRIVDDWAKEAITSTTFDQAWADVLYKVLLEAVNFPFLNTWRLWTRTVPFNDLSFTKKFIRFGEYSTFSTVAENGTYNPVTTPSDEQVSFVPSKYGGLEEISWEAILRDDVGLISRIPISLGKGWAWTVYDLVYGQLQSNSGNGPTMDYDSTALYNARTITNIVGSALADASLQTARIQMQKMAALTSGKRVLYTPKYLLYASPDLERTAWELTANQYKVNPLDTNNSQLSLSNFFGPGNPGGGLIPIGVVYPTATTQRWELVADPTEVETAYVGFLGGRSEPEIFVQDAETVGSKFSADKTTYKLRGTAGFEPANHRAFQRGQNN